MVSIKNAEKIVQAIAAINRHCHYRIHNLKSKNMLYLTFGQGWKTPLLCFLVTEKSDDLAIADAVAAADAPPSLVHIRFHPVPSINQAAHNNQAPPRHSVPCHFLASTYRAVWDLQAYPPPPALFFRHFFALILCPLAHPSSRPVVPIHYWTSRAACQLQLKELVVLSLKLMYPSEFS